MTPKLFDIDVLRLILVLTFMPLPRSVLKLLEIQFISDFNGNLENTDTHLKVWRDIRRLV